MNEVIHIRLIRKGGYLMHPWILTCVLVEIETGYEVEFTQLDADYFFGFQFAKFLTLLLVFYLGLNRASWIDILIPKLTLAFNQIGWLILTLLSFSFLNSH